LGKTPFCISVSFACGKAHRLGEANTRAKKCTWQKRHLFTGQFISNEVFRELSLSVIWYLIFSTPGIRIAGLPSVYPYPVIYAMHRKLAILDVLL
jgi:hypothetical protein